MTGKTKRFARGLFVDSGEFVHHATWKNVGCPLFHAAFATTHTYFERLPRDRAIRENSNPELAEALYVARDRHTCGFNLSRRKTSWFNSLHCEVAERDVGPTMGNTLVVALHALSKLGSLW